jgi:hypothetical protein
VKSNAAVSSLKVSAGHGVVSHAGVCMSREVADPDGSGGAGHRGVGRHP